MMTGFVSRIHFSARSLALMAVAALAIGAVLYSDTCRTNPHLFIYEPKGVAPGYVLAAPYLAGSYVEGPGEVLLLDEHGATAHQWNTEHQVLNAMLKKNGNLVVAMTPPIDLTQYPSVGTTGMLQELDWEGNVLWEYADPLMTHDFEILSDDSIAYLRWSFAPAWFAESVQGGMQSATTSVWTNEIVVVDQSKNVTWSWKAHEYLSPHRFILSPFVPRADWAHINSIRYLTENPITHEPAFLLSARHISKVFMVSIKTGEVIWESNDGVFALQHDATLLQDGNILAFDNGLFRKGPPALLSAVRILNPKTQEMVWTYDGGKGGQTMFASSVAGGAERLQNGNTLITVSTTGRIYEVTPDKRVVWEYASDFRDTHGDERLIFKARKYDADGTLWKRKLPVSLPSLLCKDY